ncbi:MAG TPA: hypothetical protein VH083_07455 [Myxococcales bacterium]|jgi:hypothetical protein|nr:hypothetical protein [Myxococcales bacterium]
MRSALLAIVILAGCSTAAVRKDTIVDLPVVLPLYMCPQPGTVATSLGDVGERMVCERQLPIGSHLPRCVCRDEGFIAQQTAETQDLLHKLQMQPTAQPEK